MRIARAWYRSAQRRDIWPGEAYDGTSVLAGCLEGRARGYYEGFTWARRAEQLLAGVALPEDDGGGPAVIGVEWTERSYDTDSLGVLRPGGQIVGGHCVYLPGVVTPADLDSADEDARQLREDLEELRLLDGVAAVLADEEAAAIGANSWGLTFGRAGLFVVAISTVRGWFAARGEFAQPQGRRLPERRTAVSEGDEQSTGGDTTLHIPAAEVQAGDRIVDGLPETWPQESATVRGFRHVTGWGGRRVQVTTTAGVVMLGASTQVTVRRAVP
jgi:hypothetical protein